MRLDSVAFVHIMIDVMFCKWRGSLLREGTEKK
jgi:hypothetical protein